MAGMLAIVVSLLLLMYLAYRGVTVLLLAPLMAALAVILSGDLALLLQAGLLRQHSSDAVFDAFCASRLEGAAHVFGTLPAGTDFDPLIARAMPLEIA